MACKAILCGFKSHLALFPSAISTMAWHYARDEIVRDSDVSLDNGRSSSVGWPEEIRKPLELDGIRHLATNQEIVGSTPTGGIDVEGNPLWNIAKQIHRVRRCAREDNPISKHRLLAQFG